ncbi:MAG: vanadium-dependent haloperoxidase [Hyphomicrobiales bacterium]|nr:vanadium-dependent haloperoxidase [Hyphomicrobiales bacterium]
MTPGPAYDPIAVGVVSGTALKGLGGANNEANKREAISHAAFAVLRTLAPQHRHALIERMQELGYDPNAGTLPAKVGRRAAAAVLTNCRDDGANEAGNFADTTGYEPRTPGAPDAWRPIESFGRRQLPTTPQWSRVMPFSLARADQFRPIPPPAPGTAEWSRQIDVLIKTSSALTDKEKAETEYWGIFGMAPAPQLIEMTKFVSDANDLRLDDDVKLFLVASNAIFDASIAVWDAKYAYDYVRPITAIRALGDTMISAWRPRSLAVLAYSTPAALAEAKGSVALPAGLGVVRAAEWEPYLPTPPFPAYVSGHSAFTAAWARAMELATGKPDFNFKTTVKRLYVEQRELAEPVTISYPTFADAAEASGMSRIWGGVHWPADNDRGLELGRRVGENVWRRAQQFILGAASPAAAAFAALRPPFWSHDNETPDHPANFEAISGLAVDLPPQAAGMWRSIVVDAAPAGAYELKLKAKASGDEPVRLKVAIEPGESSQADAPLASTEAIIPATGSDSVVTLPWTSDGDRSFRVSIEARADDRGARLLVSPIKATRVWPTVAGSPRYYEPNSAGQPDIANGPAMQMRVQGARGEVGSSKGVN